MGSEDEKGLRLSIKKNYIAYMMIYTITISGYFTHKNENLKFDLASQKNSPTY